jgi:hypothetical protein
VVAGVALLGVIMLVAILLGPVVAIGVLLFVVMFQVVSRRAQRRRPGN